MYTCATLPAPSAYSKDGIALGQGEAHDGLASKSTAERPAWDDWATGAWTVGVAYNPPEKKKKKRYSRSKPIFHGKMHKTSLHVLFEKGCWTLNIYIYATNISKTHGIQQAVKGYRDFIDEATMLGHHVSQHWNLDISFPMKIIKCLEIHA